MSDLNNSTLQPCLSKWCELHHAGPMSWQSSSTQPIQFFDSWQSERKYVKGKSVGLGSLVNREGRRLQLMKEIIDHEKRQNAMSEGDAFYSTKTGPRPKRSTRGWRFLVEWKDGSTWVPLKDLKDSYPVQVVDYAELNNLTQEPAFRWWVPLVIKKRNCILKKVKSKYWSTSH